MNISGLRSRLNLFYRGILSPIKDVFIKAAVKKERLLGNNRRMFKERLAFNLSNIRSVNFNAALDRVIKTRYQVYNSRFSCTAFTHNCENLSFMDGKINTLQDKFFAAIVRKTHILEANAFFNFLQRYSLWIVFYRRFYCEKLKNPAYTGQRLL